MVSRPHLMYALEEPMLSEFSSKKIFLDASGRHTAPSVPSANSSQLSGAALSTAAPSSRGSGFALRGPATDAAFNRSAQL